MPRALILFSSILSLGPGCEERQGAGEKIFLRSEAYFYGKPGDTVGPLVVQVLGKPIQGAFGRGGFRDPVPDKSVLFLVRDIPKKQGRDGQKAESKYPAPRLLAGPSTEAAEPETGEASSPNISIEATSDSDGYARVWVKLPVAVGDWRIRAGIRDQFDDEKTVAFAVVSGIRVLPTGEENFPGRRVQAAVQVFKVAGGQAVPDVERPVQFRIVDLPWESTARLGRDRLADQVKTNGEGIAVVDITLGNRSGPYYVIAEPKSDKEEGSSLEAPIPAAIIRRFAVDWTLAAAEVLGGAFLFLLGLRFLSSGLLNLIGSALLLPVTTFQKSPVLGFAGGIAAGAMFQSSMSVTSRLISFSNGGILTASGAVSMILGASIGRTLLPQILAFPVGFVAIILVVLGALGLFTTRRLGAQAWGWLLLGGGLVILGFDLIDWGVEIFGSSPSFQSLLEDWNYTAATLSLGGSIWVFLAVALSVTAASFLLRNSNILVMAAIALENAGLIAIPVALPFVLGANLGPALALALTSLGKRREARRIALFQLLFPLFGSTWFLILSLIQIHGAPIMIHLADWITPGFLLHPIPEHVGHHIAMIHTIFNVLNAVAFALLAKPILRFTDRAIPRDPVQDNLKPYSLDPNLIEVPGLAILQATREVTFLTELCRKAIAESFDAFRYRDLKLADQTARREESIAGVHRETSHYLLQVSENSLSRREASRIQILQATTGNLLRTAELGERLRDLTERGIEEGSEIPEDVARDLNTIYDLVMAQFDNILQLLDRPDGRTEENAVKIAERLAKLGSRVEHAWSEKIRSLGQERGAHPVAPLEKEAPPGGGKEVKAIDPSGAEILSAEGSGPSGSTRSASPEGAGPSAGGKPSAYQAFSRILLQRDAFEILFAVAGHLSHITERMRVLSPER